MEEEPTPEPQKSEPSPEGPEQIVVELKPKKPGYFDAPTWVMLRSALVPGWGQLHNRAWIKGLAIAAVEVNLGLKLLDDQRELDALDKQVVQARLARDDELEENLVTRYNDRLDSFVARQWLMAGLLAYSLLDAYIDAHFRNFDAGFRGDPALPAGPSPSPGLRFSLRWHF